VLQGKSSYEMALASNEQAANPCFSKRERSGHIFVRHEAGRSRMNVFVPKLIPAEATE